MGLFYTKMEIPNFLFAPLWTSTFGGALAPQGDLLNRRPSSVVEIKCPLLINKIRYHHVGQGSPT